MQFIKRLFINGVLAVISIAVALTAGEILLRMTLFNFNPYEVSPGEGVPYNIQRLEFKTTMVWNSQELRGDEIPVKADGEFRILCLGDSFTVGIGVEEQESYPFLLNELLRQKAPNAHVINAGGPHAMRERVKFMQTTGMELNPDAVVLQIFVGNDFYDQQNDLEDDARLLRETLISDETESVSEPLKMRLKSWLRDRCALARLFWHVMIRVPWIDEKLYLADMRYDNRGIYLKEHPEFEKKLVKSHRRDFDRFVRILEDRGIQLAVIIIPDRQQVYQGHLFDGRGLQTDKPNAIVRQDCAERGIPYIDFLQVYEGVDPKFLSKFYYRMDMHWTPVGQRFAAEELAVFLPAVWPEVAGKQEQ